MTTFLTWMRTNRRFRLAVKKAEADSITSLVKTITTAGRRNWTASAWMLERRHPDDFGRRERIDHANAEGKAFKVYVSNGAGAVSGAAGTGAFEPDKA